MSRSRIPSRFLTDGFAKSSYARTIRLGASPAILSATSSGLPGPSCQEDERGIVANKSLFFLDREDLLIYYCKRSLGLGRMSDREMGLAYMDFLRSRQTSTELGINMASKSRPTFRKRSREIARQQKQEAKEARRLEAKKRKAEAKPKIGNEDPDIAGIRPGPQPLPEHWDDIGDDVGDDIGDDE